MFRFRRSGFTLVELLVVIAIIGVMVGLLLPAVQAAREAARRMSCSNNMKQLGLGLHNYHAAYNRFPAGVRGGTSPSEGWGFSYWYGLLPFIEQQGLYEQLVVVGGASPSQCPGWVGAGAAGWTDSAGNLNAKVANNVVVASFVCPSNPMQPNRVVYQSNVTFPSYIGIEGGVDEDAITAAIAASPPAAGAPGDTDQFQNKRQRLSAAGPYVGGAGIQSWGGALVGNDYITFKHLTDGTSNVIVFGEVGDWMKDTSQNLVDMRGVHGWPMGTSDGTIITDFADHSSGVDTRHFSLNSIRYPIGTRVTTLRGVGSDFAANNPLISAHTGGVQITLADGSVRFFTNSTDLPLLKRLATRDSGVPKELP